MPESEKSLLDHFKSAATDTATKAASWFITTSSAAAQYLKEQIDSNILLSLISETLSDIKDEQDLGRVITGFNYKILQKIQDQYTYQIVESSEDNLSSSDKKIGFYLFEKDGVSKVLVVHDDENNEILDMNTTLKDALSTSKEDIVASIISRCKILPKSILSNATYSSIIAIASVVFKQSSDRFQQGIEVINDSPENIRHFFLEYIDNKRKAIKASFDNELASFTNFTEFYKKYEESYKPWLEYQVAYQKNKQGNTTAIGISQDAIVDAKEIKEDGKLVKSKLRCAVSEILKLINEGKFTQAREKINATTELHKLTNLKGNLEKAIKNEENFSEKKAAIKTTVPNENIALQTAIDNEIKSLREAEEIESILENLSKGNTGYEKTTERVKNISSETIKNYLNEKIEEISNRLDEKINARIKTLHESKEHIKKTSINQLFSEIFSEATLFTEKEIENKINGAWSNYKTLFEKKQELIKKIESPTNYIKENLTGDPARKNIVKKNIQKFEGLKVLSRILRAIQTETELKNLEIVSKILKIFNGEIDHKEIYKSDVESFFKSSRDTETLDLIKKIVSLSLENLAEKIQTQIAYILDNLKLNEEGELIFNGKTIVNLNGDNQPSPSISKIFEEIFKENHFFLKNKVTEEISKIFNCVLAALQGKNSKENSGLLNNSLKGKTTKTFITLVSKNIEAKIKTAINEMQIGEKALKIFYFVAMTDDTPENFILSVRAYLETNFPNFPQEKRREIIKKYQAITTFFQSLTTLPASLTNLKKAQEALNSIDSAPVKEALEQKFSEIIKKSFSKKQPASDISSNANIIQEFEGAINAELNKIPLDDTGENSSQVVLYDSKEVKNLAELKKKFFTNLEETWTIVSGQENTVFEYAEQINAEKWNKIKDTFNNNQTTRTFTNHSPVNGGNEKPEETSNNDRENSPDTENLNMIGNTPNMQTIPTSTGPTAENNEESQEISDSTGKKSNENEEDVGCFTGIFRKFSSFFRKIDLTKINILDTFSSWLRDCKPKAADYLPALPEINLFSRNNYSRLGNLASGESNDSDQEDIDNSSNASSDNGSLVS